MSQQWLSDQYSADDSATEVAAKTEATAIEDGDPVRIMGNLTLPPISMSPFSANPDIRHTIEAVLPHIRKLDSRDLRSKSYSNAQRAPLIVYSTAGQNPHR
jgi:hypothetical protein